MKCKCFKANKLKIQLKCLNKHFEVFYEVKKMKDVVIEIIHRICYKIYKFVHSSFVTNTTFGKK